MKNNTIIYSLITITVFTSLILTIGFPYWTSDTVTFTVADKERIVTKSGDSVSSKYLIFTELETFENSDCLVMFKFSSSDLQGKLKKGNIYTAKVYGWRVPFLSMYRNIVSVKYNWNK